MSPIRSMGFGIWTYEGVARLRDKVTLADARTELNGLIREAPEAFPGDLFARANTGAIHSFSAARTLKERTVGSVGRALWIQFASVGLVLAIACANVANLFWSAPRRDSRNCRPPGARRGATRYRALLCERECAACGRGWHHRPHPRLGRRPSPRRVRAGQLAATRGNPSGRRVGGSVHWRRSGRSDRCSQETRIVSY
jgi:hypothetical protein